MNLQVISEHTIDVDLLPAAGGRILDLGCRGFGFKKAFPNHFVSCIDCDILKRGEDDEDYIRCAVSNYDGKAGVKRTSDPQATSIVQGADVDCVTLSSLCKKLGCQFWDVIKIDIEGSEYQVIMDMDKPTAKQLSIEFHLHTGAYTQYQMRLMELKLTALGYETVQHTLEPRHGLTLNYWDSLFILK